MNKKDKNARNAADADHGIPAAETKLFNTKFSRRDMLRLTGASGIGLLLGGGGVGGIMAARQAAGRAVPAAAAFGQNEEQADTIPFYGKHQAGILTPAQNFLCFASFDVTTTSVGDVQKLMQAWTTAAAALTSGTMIGTANDKPNLPPTDTGEADGLTPFQVHTYLRGRPGPV